jgi:hypothetical protein
MNSPVELLDPINNSHCSMSYNPLTWSHIVSDLSELQRVPVRSLGVTRRGPIATFPVAGTSVYSPFARIGEAATAAASVAQLAAFNPYVAGAAALGLGAKFIYDGLKK